MIRSGKDALQLLAILCVIGMLSVIFHKGYADIAVLAREFSGAEFWLRLGRYFLANLSGG